MFPRTQVKRRGLPVSLAMPTAVLAVLLALSAGCGAPDIETRHRDWRGYTGPGADVLNEPEVPLPRVAWDPHEPLNRDLEGFNQDLTTYAAGPLSRGWRAVTPKDGRKRLDMAYENLGFPRRAVNEVLQGEWGQAGTESARFLINTTVGLLGFFDPASGWGWRAPPAEDTGLTLQKAGWEESDYIFVPVLGPSTTRDLVGKVPDTLLDISFWIGGWVPAFLGFNQASDLIPTYQNLVETNQDAYALMRMGWTILRDAAVADFRARPGDGVADQTLEAVFMQPRDPDFFRRSTGGTVTMCVTNRELPYELWMQPRPAPMAYVIPGLGSHRLSSQPITLAESLYDGGWSVAVISSAFNFDFIQNASSAPLVGYTPIDVNDIHNAFDLIDQAVVARYGAHRITGRSLMGISMGSFHTAFLAGTQATDWDDERVRFDQFAAFALPVSLHHGVRVLDDYFRAPLNWPAAEQAERQIATVRKALQLGDGTFRPGQPIPFSEHEAEYLIGLAFRFTVMDLIWTTQSLHDRGVLLTERDPEYRTPAYREILQYGWEEYFYAFVLPWLKEEGLAATPEAAFAAADLHYVQDGLIGNPRLWVFGSDNDFLRRPEDNQWLHNILPPGHLNLKHKGGHLGNAWDPQLRAEVLGELKVELEKLVRASRY